jgi:hypothetical protein
MSKPNPRSVYRETYRDVNPDGHSQTLEPRHPGNTNAARSGVYSPRLREPRAREIADAIMVEPHTVAIDAIGAAEIGRIEALIEAIDTEIARSRLISASKASSLLDLRLRASRRLAEWARQLAESESLGETIRRKRQKIIQAP